LRRSLGYPRPFRGSVAGILALVLIAGALNALAPLVLKHIFDALGAGQAWRSVVLGVVLLVGAGLLREGVNAVSNWLTEPGMRKVSGVA
jgi:ABC-type multidrug transport system fused ATPase/permease subunit